MKVDWKLRDRIEKIIDSNCREIPYEGTEVNKSSIKEEFINLLEELEEPVMVGIRLDKTKADS